MMYSFSSTLQLEVFLHSVAYGIILGVSESVAYFICGIFISSPEKRHIAADVIFSVFMTFSLFCFCLVTFLGKLRIYMLLGIAFGVVIYFSSFGQVIDFICEKLILSMRWLILSIKKPFCLFFKALKQKNIKKETKKSS